MYFHVLPERMLSVESLMANITFERSLAVVVRCQMTPDHSLRRDIRTVRTPMFRFLPFAQPWRRPRPNAIMLVDWRAPISGRRCRWHQLIAFVDRIRMICVGRRRRWQTGNVHFRMRELIVDRIRVRVRVGRRWRWPTFALDLQTSGDLLQRGQLLLIDAHRTAVDEIQQRFEIAGAHVGQHNVRMRAALRVLLGITVQISIWLQFQMTTAPPPTPPLIHTSSSPFRTLLAALRTILCAGKRRPPAASVQSTRSTLLRIARMVDTTESLCPSHAIEYMDMTFGVWTKNALVR